MFFKFSKLFFILNLVLMSASAKATDEEALNFLHDHGSVLVTPGAKVGPIQDPIAQIVEKYVSTIDLEEDILVVNINDAHPTVLGNLGFCTPLFQKMPVVMVWGNGDLAALLYQKFGSRPIYKNLTGLFVTKNTQVESMLASLGELLQYGPHKETLRFLGVHCPVDDEDLNTLGGAIKGLDDLTVLDLSEQSALANQGLRMLSEIMGESPSLRALLLRNMDLRAQGAFPTVWPAHLTHVDLQGSKISPTAIKSLLESTINFRFAADWVTDDFDREFSKKFLDNISDGVKRSIIDIKMVDIKKVQSLIRLIPYIGEETILTFKDIKSGDIKLLQELLVLHANMDLQSNQDFDSNQKQWIQFHNLAKQYGYFQKWGNMPISITSDSSTHRSWDVRRIIYYNCLDDDSFYGNYNASVIKLNVFENQDTFEKSKLKIILDEHPDFPRCLSQNLFYRIYSYGPAAIEQQIKLTRYLQCHRTLTHFNIRLYNAICDIEEKDLNELHIIGNKLLEDFLSRMENNSFAPHFINKDNSIDNKILSPYFQYDNKEKSILYQVNPMLGCFTLHQFLPTHQSAERLGKFLEGQPQIVNVQIDWVWRGSLLTYNSPLNVGLDYYGAKAISNGFRTLSLLKYLCLNENNLTDDGISAIASQFCHLPNLEELRLYGNMCGDSGAQAIANNLCYLKKLYHIDLHQNQVGHNGRVAIANSYVKHCVMTYPYPKYRSTIPRVMFSSRGSANMTPDPNLGAEYFYKIRKNFRKYTYDHGPEHNIFYL